MAISLDKILTITASEWIDAHPVNSISNYDLVGVHLINNSLDININQVFADNVPSEAVAVVSYKVSSGGGIGAIYSSASGTALIPRKG